MGTGRILRLAVTASLFAAGAPAGGFLAVATHPGAARQATAAGRVLVTLAPFGGRLYAGYGDYGANGGPIEIRAFDPATGRFGPALLTAQTEAVCLFREIGGRLFAPHTDPIAGSARGAWAAGEAALPDDRWTDRVLVEGYHFFDVASFDGSDLWLAGSYGTAAALWRSTDGGATLPEPPALVQQPASGISRYYFLATFQGRLWTQAFRFHASRVFDGTDWTDGPDLLPSGGFGWHPQELSGELLYQLVHSGYGPSPLLGFDGSRVRTVLAADLYDFAVAGGTLVALVARRLPGAGGLPGPWVADRVVRSADLCAWSEVAAVPPPDARSVAVLDGTLYLGAEAGVLYRLDEPLDPPVAGPPPEVRNLLAVRRGGDVELSWDAHLGHGSCETFAVLATDQAPAADPTTFRALASGLDLPRWTDRTVAGRPFRAWLVRADSPHGTGPGGR